MTTACVDALLIRRRIYANHIVASYGSKSKYIDINSDCDGDFLKNLSVLFYLMRCEYDGNSFSVAARHMLLK